MRGGSTPANSFSVVRFCVTVFAVKMFTYVYSRYWMLDPARFVIFVASLLLITLGSRRAVYLDRNSTEAEAEGASISYFNYLPVDS